MADTKIVKVRGVEVHVPVDFNTDPNSEDMKRLANQLRENNILPAPAPEGRA